MDADYESQESMGRICAFVRAEAPMNRIGELVGKIGVAPDRLIRASYIPKTDQVHLMYAMGTPNVRLTERMPVLDAEPVFSTCRFTGGILLFEASFSTASAERMVAETAHAVSHAVASRFDARQLFFAGMDTTPVRQYLRYPEGELYQLSRIGMPGIVSVRFDPLNRLLFGVRLNEGGRGVSIARFNDSVQVQREPTRLLQPDAWTDLEDKTPLSITSLSAPRMRRGSTEFIANLSGNIKQRVRIVASANSFKAEWGKPFRTPGNVIGRIDGRKGLGVICAPARFGDKFLTSVMDVSLEPAESCQTPDLAAYIS